MTDSESDRPRTREREVERLRQAILRSIPSMAEEMSIAPDELRSLVTSLQLPEVRKARKAEAQRAMRDSRRTRRPIGKTAALEAAARRQQVKVAYLCAADEFALERLRDYYESLSFSVKMEYDVLHVNTVDPRTREAIDLFLFKYGSVVYWGGPYGFTRYVEQDYLSTKGTAKVAQAMTGRYPADILTDCFPVFCTYEMVDELAEGEFEITLQQKDHFIVAVSQRTEMLLCVSHALAQSAKIEYMELRIKELTEKCRPLPCEMKERGTVSISDRSLLQLRGEVLFYRLMLKSGSDLLDEPEVFWDHSALKHFYVTTKDFFLISERMDVLDTKLDAANEILMTIADQFSQRHSSRLEWIVIWLVLVEVIIGVVELLLDIKPWVK